MRIFAHCIRQHTTLIKPDISGRRTDQSGNGMLFHVFTHVKAFKINSHDKGQLLCQFCFSYTGRSGEQKRANWMIRMM